MLCKNCGKEQAQDALFCPQCGARLGGAVKKIAPRSLTTALGALSILLLAAVVFLAVGKINPVIGVWNVPLSGSYSWTLRFHEDGTAVLNDAANAYEYAYTFDALSKKGKLSRDGFEQFTFALEGSRLMLTAAAQGDEYTLSRGESAQKAPTPQPVPEPTSGS